MRKKRTVKPSKEDTSLSYKFTCKCGFELVYHTDMEFKLPKQCPMCKDFAFTSHQTNLCKEIEEGEVPDDHIEEYQCESEQSA